MQKTKILLWCLNLIIVGIFVWQAPFLYKANKIGINNIKEIIEAHDIIKKVNIYQNLTSEDLFSAALIGMTSSVDRFSSYTKKETKDEPNKQYTGIGVSIYTDAIYKLSLLKTESGKTPAELAGIQNGDILLEINGTAISKIPPEDITNKIKGESDSSVKLKILHAKTNIVEEIVINKAKISPVDMKYHNISQDIAMLYLASFENDTDIKWYEYIRQAKLSGAPKCLVLDFRENLGGNVSAALNVTDMFIAHKDGEEKRIITEVKLDMRPLNSANVCC